MRTRFGFTVPIVILLLCHCGDRGLARAASSGLNAELDQETLDNEFRMNIRDSRINDAREDLHDGARVDGRSPSGKTALMIAAEYCFAKEVRMLLERGADPNLKDAEGRTPLIYAARESCLEAASMLVRHAAVVSVADRQGKTALDYARSAAELEVDGAATRIVRLLESSPAERLARLREQESVSKMPVVSLKNYMPRRLLDQVEGKVPSTAGTSTKAPGM